MRQSSRGSSDAPPLSLMGNRFTGDGQQTAGKPYLTGCHKVYGLCGHLYFLKEYGNRNDFNCLLCGGGSDRRSRHYFRRVPRGRTFAGFYQRGRFFDLPLKIALIAAIAIPKVIGTLRKKYGVFKTAEPDYGLDKGKAGPDWNEQDGR